MKLNLTIEQYRKLIKESIDSAIVLNEAPNDRFIKGFKNSIANDIQAKMQDDNDFRSQADELGINSDYSDDARNEYKKQIRSKNGRYNQSVNDEIKAVVNILKGVTTYAGGIDFEKLRNDAESGKYSVNGKQLTYSRILRIKDFIDSMSLRHLYDNSIAPTITPKFGLKPASDITKIGKETSEEGYYDPARDPKYFDINNVSDEMLDDANSALKSKGKKIMTKAQYKAKILDKYLQSAYGINFNAPSFDVGNKKVVGALMINFTSAFKCPAWNECLVKHACYARAGEVRHYDNTKTSNDRKNLMWLAADKDPKMMNLVYNLLKAYVVSWSRVEKMLKKSPDLFNSIGGDIEKLSTMKFSDMPEGVIDVIKKCKRVSYIRLNENGDFINQHILDSFDEMAGDFKLIDVNTAAYSCRNLQFDKLKNIVINASRMRMTGPTIQRYFYAIPTKMYEDKSFEDTYTSFSMTNGFDSIGKTPKKLFNIDKSGKRTFNGSYYYKCPCSRKDFTLIGDNGEVKNNSEVNCYQCHLCYEQNDDVIKDEEVKNALKNGGKLFVFVKAHGTFANILDEKRELEIIKRVGVPEKYQPGLRDNGEGYDNTEVSVKESKSLITESSMQNDAFKEITKNAIYSMTQHFKQIGVNESKTRAVSKNFLDTMKLIEEVDKKRYNDIID